MAIGLIKLLQRLTGRATETARTVDAAALKPVNTSAIRAESWEPTTPTHRQLLARAREEDASRFVRAWRSRTCLGRDDVHAASKVVLKDYLAMRPERLWAAALNRVYDSRTGGIREGVSIEALNAEFQEAVYGNAVIAHGVTRGPSLGDVMSSGGLKANTVYQRAACKIPGRAAPVPEAVAFDSFRPQRLSDLPEAELDRMRIYRWVLFRADCPSVVEGLNASACRVTHYPGLTSIGFAPEFLVERNGTLSDVGDEPIAIPPSEWLCMPVDTDPEHGLKFWLGMGGREAHQLINVHPDMERLLQMAVLLEALRSHPIWNPPALNAPERFGGITLGSPLVTLDASFKLGGPEVVKPR